MKKLGKGYYHYIYKDFEIEVYIVSSTWYAEVKNLKDYALMDRLSAEDEKRKWAIERIEGKIDAYLEELKTIK